MRSHGLTATVSSIHVNGWIGAHHKLSAAHWAVPACLGGLGFEPADWVYVGDSTNDQLMFEHLPLTVGVANVARFVPVMRALPAWVTAAERGRGFAELASALLAARHA
jgi:hydroxymethylpyrimidine pyrophosphatase-like HAD family hydrolase